MEFGCEDTEVWCIATAGRFIVAFVDWWQAACEGRVSAAEVGGIVVSERADDGSVFGESGEVLEVFADLQSGCCSLNGFEFAADFGWSEGFEVKSIELAWSAPHEEQEAAAGLSEAWREWDCGQSGRGLCRGGGGKECKGAGGKEGATVQE